MHLWTLRAEQLSYAVVGFELLGLRSDAKENSTGRTSDETSLDFCNSTLEDVNGDGLLDVVCHFNTMATGFLLGDTQGVLKGKTRSGVPIKGTDSVRIVM